jgi:hypothetical protein
VLAWGRKVWFMRPPAAAEYSTVPAARFALSLAEAETTAAAAGTAGAAAAERPLRCTQRGGDVLFVPAGWSHAVLNTRTSIGFAVEFESALGVHY